MIVTDSEDVYQKLKLIRSHGRFEETPGDYFFTIKEMDYIQVGYNFRMPTLCAALGVSQFHKLQKTVRMRQENAHYLTSLLSKYHSVTCPVELPHSVHVYQMYTIQLPDKKTRDGLQQQLYKDGIMTKVYFDPIHLKTYYRKLYGCKKGQLPDTEALSDRILTLPMYPTLTTQEMDCIGASFNTYFGGSKP